MQTWLTAVSVVLAVAAAIFLLVAPVYSGFDGKQPTHATLIEVNGSWAVMAVMFPVLMALMPLVFRRRAMRIAATIVMLGFALISGFSIGLFYLPACLVALMALAAGPSGAPAPRAQQ